MDETICDVNDLDHSDMNHCYRSYINGIRTKAEESGQFSTVFDAKAYVDSLANGELFDLIWVLKTNMYRSHRDSPYVEKPYLYYNKEGAYYQFLNEYVHQEGDELLEQYVEIYKIMGDISPSMFASMLKDFNKQDFSNPATRLIYHIHFLTVGCNYNVKGDN